MNLQLQHLQCDLHLDLCSLCSPRDQRSYVHARGARCSRCLLILNSASSPAHLLPPHQVRQIVHEPRVYPARPNSRLWQTLTHRSTPRWHVLRSFGSAQWPDSPLQTMLTHPPLRESRIACSTPTWRVRPNGGQVNVASGWLGRTTVLSQPCDI